MDILKQMVSNDSRIKVIRNDKNYGTYISKNIGIKYAKGEFITFNDSDDISISTRIKTQITFLKKNTKYGGCVCGFFSRSKKKIAIAEITLFLRHLVIDEVGFFDSVRVGADTEYRRRLEICNIDIFFIKKYLYTCLDRLMECNNVGKCNSLTVSEKIGIKSNIRHNYRKHFNYFHEVLKNNLKLKYLPFPLKNRPYIVKYANDDDKSYMEPELSDIMIKHLDKL